MDLQAQEKLFFLRIEYETWYEVVGTNADTDGGRPWEKRSVIVFSYEINSLNAK